VRDGNWISSRQPDDIPLFNKAMLGLFTKLTADNQHSEAERRGEPVFREQLDLDDDLS
jgi:hypothetical protein